MFPRIKAHGPEQADILIVGEAPGMNEILSGLPFIGASGQELDRMLHEVGVMRTECRITNVCPYQPPNNEIDYFMPKEAEALARGYRTLNGKWCSPEILCGIQELYEEIVKCQPKLIIALGNTPLWALTGNAGITKWRGSQLHISQSSPVCVLSGGLLPSSIKLVPTFHPASILRSWEQRWSAVHDLRRAVKWYKAVDWVEPQYDFVVQPSWQQTMEYLEKLKVEALDSEYYKLSVDIETRAGYISCIGIAKSPSEAICIPLAKVGEEPNYFASLEEESAVKKAIVELLELPTVQVVGQNFLYDMQYLLRELGVYPKVGMDTMIAHHSCFPGTPKGLHVLSSLYCEHHVYWKDEGKNFNPRYHDEVQLWTYNCIDAVRTFESSDVLETVISKMGLREVYEFQMSMFEPILDIMIKGVRFDTVRQNSLAAEFKELAGKYEEYFEYIIGHHVGTVGKKAKAWYRSNTQLKVLFYEELGCRPVKNRKTKKLTTDDQALQAFMQEKPILGPLCEALREYRSIEVYVNTFLTAKYDEDSRMRCYYNIAGPETFRFSSSQNAFGSGMNLQNIPGEDEEAEISKREFTFPNVRELFLPDPGYTIFEGDLKQADAQVVAAEADDEELLAMFRDPKCDVHTENSKVIFGDAKGNHRHMAKQGVHLTNYGGTAFVLSKTLGITQHEAEFFQSRWFHAHPKIREWHHRIEMQLAQKRFVENKFGNRRFYFDRIQTVLKEALAWIPQSTVALVIDRAMMNIIAKHPDTQILMQVHDSLVMQIKTENFKARLPEIAKDMLITIPYNKPLIIPVSFKSSAESWGKCNKVEL